MHKSLFGKKLVNLFLLTAILFGNFSAFAQKRTGASKTSATKNQTVASNQKKEEKKDCNGAYTGIVTYNRTIKTTYAGKYGSNYNRTYVYNSTISIRDDGSSRGSIYPQVSGIGGSFNFYGDASATLTEEIKDLQVSEKDDYCKLTLKGAQGKTRVRCESRFNRQVKADGRDKANVFLGFNGNTYKISLDNPKVNGQMNESSKSSCTGTCSPDKPIDSSRSDIVKDATQNGTYTDPIPFDPTNFNRLSGTFTRTNGDETVTITWHLSRCAPPLQIDGLAFEEHRVPDAEKWYGIDPLSGTTDGNRVKVKTKVFNSGGETAYATVKFSDTVSNELLPDGTVSVAVKPGETRDVEFEWDTSGYAWDENQKPKSRREIKAEIEGTGESVKEKILVHPKPVITVHGLWSNEGAWAEWHKYLREAHSVNWRAFPVGEDPANGKMNTGDHPGNYTQTNTIYQNARELEKQIKFVRKNHNAWHVDIVAHSMGGLISRQYINSFMNTEFDARPTVTHLVMLGTPNQGSPCADTVNQVFEDAGHNNMEAMRELKPVIVRAFNQRITDRKQVKFSILVGTPVPFTCLTDIRGDGVVPIQSALWTIADHDYAPRNHIALTGIEDFKSFVMPRIAVGPKKAQAEMYMSEIENRQNDNFAVNSDAYQKEDRYGFNQYFQKISYKNAENTETNDEPKDEDSMKNLTTKQKVELQGKQSKEIEIPVNDGVFAGVVLAAPIAVSATLSDANGAIIGESKGGIDAMKEMFRTIGVRKQITKAVWKLKLENLGSVPAAVFVAGFAGNGAGSDFTVEAGKPTVAGQVPLTAKWTENNSPVLTAKITASVIGQKNSIEFFDDGKHGDAAANDGIYGASVEKLPKGDYTVEAKAEANNQTKIAVVQITIGADAMTKPVTTKRKAK